MKRRAFLQKAGVLATATITTGAIAAPKKQPNFIFFITDDISQNDLGCYGNKVINTPNLDRMAKEGVVFDNAYLTISSCSPSRCSTITGRYPHNTGAPELHTTLPLDQFAFPEAMRKAGYYTVLSGKNHMGNVERAFEKISHGGGPGGEKDWVQILTDRPKDKPFFCWFASNDAHRGWAFSDDLKKYNPDDVKTPSFIYDGPITRQDLANYYHEITRTDYYMGKLREELERQGVADNTYVVYCADNGRPFPRSKVWLRDSGIKTPLIFWSPGNLKPARTKSIVSAIDYSATFLELAGIEKSPRIQGQSFVPVLKDPKAKTRDYAFAEHNWHVYQGHERMVRWDNWMYVRNAWPERQVMAVESDPTYPAGKELWQAEADGKLKPHQREVFQKPRAAEELYNLKTDPDQHKSVAADPKNKKVLAKLRGVLDQWTEQTGDSVQAKPSPDRQDVYGKKNPKYRRGEFPGASKNATRINHPGPVKEG